MLPWMAPHPSAYELYKLNTGLQEEEKKEDINLDHKVGGGLREGRGGIGGEYDQILCIHMKFLKNNYKMLN